MYRSGIQLPKVSFSQIDTSYIPTSSYFIGFDLDNIGKLSKLDKNGVITVIEGAGGNLNIKSQSVTIATGVSAINFINAVTPPLVSGTEVTVDISGATSGITLADLSAILPLAYNNLTGEFSINIASSSELGVVKIGSGLSVAPDGTLSSSGGSVTSVGLQIGTLGSDVTVLNSPIVGSGSITLNIPSAGATARGALTSDDWTKFNNKVSATRSISTTSPLQGGGTLEADRTLSIQQATTLNSGYLSNSDWNIFKNKQDALSGGTTNQLTKWTSSSVLGNSIVTESSGLLGVGLTLPTAKLHISNLTTSNSFLVEDSTNPDISPFVIDNSGNIGAGILTPTAKVHILSTLAGLDSFLVEDTTSDTSPFVIKDNGHVGIGLLTPGAKVHINNNAAGVISFLVEDDTNPDTTPFVIDTIGNVGVGLLTPGAKVHINNNAAGVISFLVEDDTAPDTTPFVIDTIGNVGIGLLTPTARLHISSTGTQYPLLIEDEVNPDTTPLVVDLDGNLGIGELLPDTKLHVRQKQISGLEEISKFGLVGINTSYLSIRNSSLLNDVYTSEIRGYQSSTTTDQAIGLSGFINSAQDTNVPGTLFKYENVRPAVLFRVGKPVDSATEPLSSRRFFEFKNWENPILTMDPTGGIKVHRGFQDGVAPADPGYVAGVYTQYIHMHGDVAGNYIESYCNPANTKTLVIRSTTNLANDPTTGVDEAFPGIALKIYDNTALLVTKNRDIGIGTEDNIVDVAAKLHVTTATRTVEGGAETPGTPGNAFRMYEGVDTTNKVILAQNGVGSTTWGKVTKDYTTGVSQTLQVAKNGGGYYNVYIQNGLITNVLTFP